MLHWSTFGLALAGALIWFFIFAGIGLGLRTATGATRRPLIHFDNLVTGIILFAAAYAIIRTGCRTMLLPVPLLLCLVLRNMPQNDFDATIPHSGGPPIRLILGITVLLLAVLFFAQGLYAFGSTAQPFPAADLNYYCRLSRHLEAVGSENERLDLPAAMQRTTELYHWGDEWLLAGVSQLSRLPEEVTLLLIIYPILAATIALGLFSLFEPHWTGRKGLLAGFCAASLLACALPGILPGLLRDRYTPFSAAVMQFPKQLLPGMLVIWLAVAARGRNMASAFAVAALSGLLFINVLPALLLWALALAGIKTLRRSWTKSEAITVAICVTSIALSALFVLWQRDNDGRLPPLNADYVGNPALRLHILMQGFVQYLSLLPFALLPALLWWRARPAGWPEWTAGERRAGLLVLMLTACGGAAWSLFYPFSQDSQQFFHNTIHAAVPLFTVWCATLLFCAPAGRAHQWIFCGLMAWCAASNVRFSRFPHVTGTVSRDDLVRIKAFFAPAPGRGPLLCVSYLADSAGAGSGTMRRATVNFYPLEALSLLHPDYTVYSLDPLFFPQASGVHAREEWRNKWLSPIMQYAYRSGLADSAASTIQQSFIKAVHAQYLIVKEGVEIPGFLRAMTADSLRLQSLPYQVYRLAEQKR